MPIKNKKTFWIISTIMLIWSLLRIVEYAAQMQFVHEEKKHLFQDAINIFEEVPTWVVYAYSFSVILGFIASILLLLRKRLSQNLFGISLLSTIALWAYNTIMVDTIVVYGPGGMVMPYVVLLISILMYLYSRKYFKA